MENKIKEFIILGKFQNAEEEINRCNITEEALENIILDVGFNQKNICAYSFTCFLLNKNEIVKYHEIASTLMEIEFCYLEGAYQVALYHTRRIIELCPDDVEWKEKIFYFNQIPDVVLENNEVEQIARDILRKDPTNERALTFLATLKNQ